MSGGTFQYAQYRIKDIYERIQDIINKSGVEKSKEDLWNDEQWYRDYPEDKLHYKYPPQVIERFKEAVAVLKKAEVYAQRVDWLVAGDDGDETFIERLKKDLKNLENEL